VNEAALALWGAVAQKENKFSDPVAKVSVWLAVRRQTTKID
jgi:hypothetical protein